MGILTLGPERDPSARIYFEFVFCLSLELNKATRKDERSKLARNLNRHFLTEIYFAASDLWRQGCKRMSLSRWRVKVPGELLTKQRISSSFVRYIIGVGYGFELGHVQTCKR